MNDRTAATANNPSREAGGLASWSGALALPVHPRNDHHLTLADVKKHAVTSNDVHACPTRLICLENTLGGTILPLQSCQEISRWARSQDPPILLHLDGARLWEAVVAGAGSLEDYTECFDSVSLCFSKGLGAPIGSMIVGKQAFIERARHVRKAMGGGLRQAGVITAAARVAVEETFLGGQLERSQERARQVARMWEAKGGSLAKPCETNMVWLDLRGDDQEDNGERVKFFVEAAVKEGVRVIGGRLVVHYQISEEGVTRLGRAMNSFLKDREAIIDGAGRTSEVLEKKAEEVMAPAVE